MGKKKEIGNDVEDLLDATESFDLVDDFETEFSDEDIDILTIGDVKLEHYIDLIEKKNPTASVSQSYNDNDFVTYIVNGNLAMGRYGAVVKWGYQVTGLYK